MIPLVALMALAEPGLYVTIVNVTMRGEHRVVRFWQRNGHAINWPHSGMQAVVDEWGPFVSPGDWAVDIGAFVGDTALGLGLLTGTSGKVFALEPFPGHFSVLQENARANPSLNIQPLNFAATLNDAEMAYSEKVTQLVGTMQAQAADRGHTSVQGRNLAKHLMNQFRPADLRKIRFIKTDCEGHDDEAIRSLELLLNLFHGGSATRGEGQRHSLPPPPVIWAEWFRPYRHGPKEVCSDGSKKLFDAAAAMGYRVHTSVRAAGTSLDEVPTELAGCQNKYGMYDILLLPNSTRGGWRPRAQPA